MQVSSKVTAGYPIDLPPVFVSFWKHLDFLSIDATLLPIGCLVNSDFHDLLVAMTLLPIFFVFIVASSWFFLRQRLMMAGGEGLQESISVLSSKAIRLCVIFLFTIFPMVSSTILQVLHFIAHVVH